MRRASGVVEADLCAGRLDLHRAGESGDLRSLAKVFRTGLKWVPRALPLFARAILRFVPFHPAIAGCWVGGPR